AGLLAHVEQLGVRPGGGQCVPGDQSVVDAHVGGDDQLPRAGGEQTRVAGTGADQEDDAGGRAHAATSSARARISAPPEARNRSARAAAMPSGSEASASISSRIHSLPSDNPQKAR